MKRHLIIIAMGVLLLAGCRSQKEYAYLKDAPRNTAMPITNNYSTTIQPNDLLHIFVYSETPESVQVFNEETNKATKRGKVNGYLVSQTGEIMFPVIGRVKVANMTLDQMSRELERQLKEGGFVKDAVVTVTLMNFGVTVIGEVKKPQHIQADGNRLTIFEALARCGDVTIDGIRSCVTVIRSQGDSVIVDTLDLTKKEVLSSPFYYLQQNDVIFVEPTEKRKRKAYRNEDWPRYMTSGAHFLQVAYTLVYRLKYNKQFREVLYGN